MPNTTRSTTIIAPRQNDLPAGNGLFLSIINQKNRKRGLLGGVLFVCLAMFFTVGLSKICFGQNRLTNAPLPIGTSRSPEISDVAANDIGFSTGNRPERSRPPLPTKIREDNHYPEGFLTLSKPQNIQPDELISPSGSNNNPPSAKEIPADYPLPDDWEPNYEVIPPHDPTYVFGMLIAAGMFGVFAFFDYRYRMFVHGVLIENNRLLAPDATSADFADVLYGVSPYELEANSAFNSSIRSSDSYAPWNSSHSLRSSTSEIFASLTNQSSSLFADRRVSPSGFSSLDPLLPYESGPSPSGFYAEKAEK